MLHGATSISYLCFHNEAQDGEGKCNRGVEPKVQSSATRCIILQSYLLEFADLINITPQNYRVNRAWLRRALCHREHPLVNMHTCKLKDLLRPEFMTA